MGEISTATAGNSVLRGHGGSGAGVTVGTGLGPHLQEQFIGSISVSLPREAFMAEVIALLSVCRTTLQTHLPL